MTAIIIIIVAVSLKKIEGIGYKRHGRLTKDTVAMLVLLLVG